MDKIIKTKYYRHIVELSIMSNNEEVVSYSKEADIELPKSDMMFHDPYVVVSRPVFDVEKIDFTYDGPLIDEKVDDTTRFLDAYYKIIEAANHFKKVLKDRYNATAFLAQYIGNNYYDCMSGGMHRFEFIICQILSQFKDVDKTEKVYPNADNKWYTLNDFISLGDQEEISKYMKLFKLLPGSTSNYI